MHEDTPPTPRPAFHPAPPGWWIIRTHLVPTGEEDGDGTPALEQRHTRTAVAGWYHHPDGTAVPAEVVDALLVGPASPSGEAWLAHDSDLGVCAFGHAAEGGSDPTWCSTCGAAA